VHHFTSSGLAEEDSRSKAHRTTEDTLRAASGEVPGVTIPLWRRRLRVRVAFA